LRQLQMFYAKAINLYKDKHGNSAENFLTLYWGLSYFSKRFLNCLFLKDLMDLIFQIEEYLFNLSSNVESIMTIVSSSILYTSNCPSCRIFSLIEEINDTMSEERNLILYRKLCKFLENCLSEQHSRIIKDFDFDDSQFSSSTHKLSIDDMIFEYFGI